MQEVHLPEPLEHRLVICRNPNCERYEYGLTEWIRPNGPVFCRRCNREAEVLPVPDDRV